MGDERSRHRHKSETDEPDVVGHSANVVDEPAEDDPEKKRKRHRKQADQPEGDDLGRHRHRH